MAEKLSQVDAVRIAFAHERVVDALRAVHRARSERPTLAALEALGRRKQEWDELLASMVQPEGE
jgi:hypothetical protein